MKRKKVGTNISLTNEVRQGRNDGHCENVLQASSRFVSKRIIRATKRIALKKMKNQLEDVEDEQPQRKSEVITANQPTSQGRVQPLSKIFDLLIPCDEEGNAFIPSGDHLSSPKYVLAAKCVSLPANFRYMHTTSKSLSTKSIIKFLPVKKSMKHLLSLNESTEQNALSKPSNCPMCDELKRKDRSIKIKLQSLRVRDRRNRVKLKKLEKLWKATRMKNIELESELKRQETSKNYVETSRHSRVFNSCDSIIQKFDKSYTDADVLKATCLRNISPLAFNFVRDVMGIPLTSKSDPSSKKSESISQKNPFNPIDSRIQIIQCNEADKSYGITMEDDDINNFDFSLGSCRASQQNKNEFNASNSDSMNDLMLKLNEYKSKIINKSSLTKVKPKKVTKKEILKQRKQQRIENGSLKKCSMARKKRKLMVKEKEEEKGQKVKKMKANIQNVNPHFTTINIQPTTIDLPGFQCQENFYTNTHMSGFSRTDNCKVYQFMQPSTSRHPYIVNYPDTALHIVEEQPNQHYHYPDNRYHEAGALANRPVTPIEQII